MKLNFNLVKTEFFKYLSEKNENTSKGISSDTSIFAYFSEWNNFLKENSAELGIPTNFSGSIMDLIDLYDENTGEFQQDNTENSEKNFFTSFIDDLLGNDKVKQLVDQDSNNQISKDEMTKFLESLDSYDDKNGIFSLDDMFQGFNAIEAENFEIKPVSLEQTAPEMSAPETSGSETPSGTNNPNGAGSPTTPNGQNTNNDTTPPVEVSEKSLENMTPEELKTEQGARENTLNDAKQNLTDVRNNDTEGIKNAQTAYDKAEDAYKNILEGNAYTELEDLYKKDLTQNKEDISKKEDDIKNIKNNISDNENQIFGLEQSISQLDSQVSAYQTAITNLGSSKDPDEQAKINQKKAELESLKAQKEKERDSLKKEKSNLEKENETLKNSDLKTAEEDLTSLKEQQTEIEKQINDFLESKGIDTKEVYQNLTDARANLEQIKQSEETAANEVINKAQQSVTEVNNKINQQDAENIISSNSLKESLKDNPFGKVDKYNEKWISGETSAPFMVITPEGIENYKDVPVVVCYPGSGGICCGEETLMNKEKNPNTMALSIMEQTGENAPKAIFVVMQTNKTNSWTNGKEDVVGYTREAIQYVKDNYDIDENNISATGHSLGGDGVRYVAQQAPELFTSKRIAPISPSSASIKINGQFIDQFISENFKVKLYSGWSGSDGCYNSSTSLAKSFYGGIQNHTTSGGGHGDAIKRAMANGNGRYRNDLNNNGLSDFFEHLLLGK